MVQLSPCGGCETKCAFHAITVDAENQKYTIDNDRYTGCGGDADRQRGERDGSYYMEFSGSIRQEDDE